jgi:MFS family permease
MGTPTSGAVPEGATASRDDVAAAASAPISPTPVGRSILAVLCLQVFVSVSFKGMAPIALPDLQRGLSANLEQLQWVVNSYVLALAAVAVAGGALADRFGRRRLLITGLVLFFAGSVVCAASAVPTELDFASGVFGIGAGLSFAPGAAMVRDSFVEASRASAFGMVGAVSAAAGACSSVLGGALVLGAGWRSVFIFSAAIPGAALIIAVSGARLATAEQRRAVRFNWTGAISFSVAIFAINFALIRGNALGFASRPILIAFAVSLCAAVLGVAAERRAAGA